MPVVPQASLFEGNKAIAEVFKAARSRQIFGVEWANLDVEQRMDYVRSFFSMEVWKHQRDPIMTITDPYLKKITYNASRQSGKSAVLVWVEIIAGIHNTHPALDGTTKVIGLANKFSQTQIIGSRVRNLLLQNYEKTKFFWDQEGSSRAHVVFKRETGVTSKMTGTIDYVTANPKAFSEGFTGSLLCVDEANRLDGKVLSEVILPYLASTAGSIVLTGVSRGRGPFYDACNSKDFVHLHYPWDKVETYRRAAPCNIMYDDGTVLEVGMSPLEQMPNNLKKILFPTNPMVHILQAPRQKESMIRMWDIPASVMSEDDFRSQFMLEWLASITAVLPLSEQDMLFEKGDFAPMDGGGESNAFWFGLDCGGSRNAYAPQDTNKDRAALCVFTRVNGIKQKVWCDEKDNIMPEQLCAWLREICHPQVGRFKCQWGTIDVTGAVGAFASQHLKDSGIPIIPIIYNRTEEITKKNYKNAIFNYFKLENASGRIQYPASRLLDLLDESNMRPVYPTFYEHREQWEKIERKLTTGTNDVISAPSGEHDDGPNADALCTYGMDHPDLFSGELNLKKRSRTSLLTPGLQGSRRGFYHR